MKLVKDEKGWRAWLRETYKKPDFEFKPPSYPVFAYSEGDAAAHLTPSELLMMVVELYNASTKHTADPVLPIVEDLVLTFRAEHGRDPLPGDRIVWPTLDNNGAACGHSERA